MFFVQIQAIHTPTQKVYVFGKFTSKPENVIQEFREVSRTAGFYCSCRPPIKDDLAQYESAWPNFQGQDFTVSELSRMPITSVKGVSYDGGFDFDYVYFPELNMCSASNRRWHQKRHNIIGDVSEVLDLVGEWPDQPLTVVPTDKYTWANISNMPVFNETNFKKTGDTASETTKEKYNLVGAYTPPAR